MSTLRSVIHSREQLVLFKDCFAVDNKWNFNYSFQGMPITFDQLFRIFIDKKTRTFGWKWMNSQTHLDGNWVNKSSRTVVLIPTLKTVHPTNYSLGVRSVMFYCGLAMVKWTHIFQGYFTGTYQWSNQEGPMCLSYEFIHTIDIALAIPGNKCMCTLYE